MEYHLELGTFDYCSSLIFSIFLPFFQATCDVPGMAPHCRKHLAERRLRPPHHRLEHRERPRDQRDRLSCGLNLLYVLQQVTEKDSLEERIISFDTAWNEGTYPLRLWKPLHISDLSFSSLSWGVAREGISAFSSALSSFSSSPSTCSCFASESAAAAADSKWMSPTKPKRMWCLRLWINSFFHLLVINKKCRKNNPTRRRFCWSKKREFS